MKTILAAAMLALVAPPAVAAPAAPAAEAAVEPERLQAAHALIEVLMPAATRNAMINGMAGSMLENITKGFAANPQLQALFASDPGSKAIVDRFISRQQSQTQQLLTDNLPGMVEAMERAYARRFTIAQMRDIEAFFATPTGRIYMAQASTIMSDPDVAAWQQRLMNGTMSRIAGETQAMVAELMAQQRPRAAQ